MQTTMATIKIFAIALALLGAHLNCNATLDDSNSDTDSLSQFTTRLLVRWRPGDSSQTPQRRQDGDAAKAPANLQQADYELEETYDKRRQLAKLVAHNATGHKVELYLRLDESLFLESQYDSKGLLIQCSLSRELPQVGVLRPYAQLWRKLNSMALLDNNRLLVGPSVLLELFQDKLKLNWRSKAKSKLLDLNHLTSNRLLAGDKTIEFTFPSSNRSKHGGEQLSRGKIQFWQPDLLIERSPLISQLAAKFRYTTEENEILQVDYLSIDQVESDVETLRDPFKLAAGFECSPEASSRPGDSAEEQQAPFWFTRLAADSSVASANLLGLPNYPEGLRWTLDLARHLVALEIPGQSRNVFDLRHSVAYHLPEEPIIHVPTPTSNNSRVDGDIPMGLKNSECVIMSAAPLLGANKATNFGFSSADLWRYLVGQTRLMMYLGKVQYANGRLAHEFSLQYAGVEEIPVYLRASLQRETLLEFSKSGRLVARLWVASADGCDDLYGKENLTCRNPQLLGYKLELVDARTLAVGQRVEVKFGEFIWQSEELDTPVTLAQAFDFSQCPVDKVKLSFEVGWSELEPISGEPTSHWLGVDELINDEVIAYLDAYANPRVFLQQLYAHETRSAGVKSIHYIAEVGQVPAEAVAFKLEPDERVAREQMLSPLINSLEVSLARSPLECIAWASQLAPASASSALLYSPKKGCFLYETTDRGTSAEFSRPCKEEDLFWLYVQSIEPTEAAKSEPGLESFKSVELPEINKEIAQKISVRSNVSALVNGLMLARDIRLGIFKLVPDDFGQVSASGRRILSLQSGYRFDESAPGKAQFEILSLAQCSSRCHQEPNCSAYSHCKLQDSGHEFCQLSELDIIKLLAGAGEEPKKAEEVVKAKLRRDSDCAIYAKDYLSYFDRLNSDLAVRRHYGAGANSWYSIELATLGTIDYCAQVCVKNFTDSCQRFAYTPRKAAPLAGAPFRCLLYLPGIELSGSHTIRRLAKEEPLNDGGEFYVRRPVSQFRRTISGPLTWSSGGGGLDPALARLSSMDASECAAECLRRDDGCLSFDWCQILISSAANNWMRGLQDIECVLLGGSALDGSIGLVPGDSATTSRSSNGTAANNDDHDEGMMRTRDCVHYESLRKTERLSGAELAALLRPNGGGQRSSRVFHAASVMGAAALGLALGVATNALLVLWQSDSIPFRRPKWSARGQVA